MKINLLLANMLMMVCICNAQVNVLDASTLAAALKINAHSVKRDEKIEFDVRSIDDARLKVHQVFTVLDVAGEGDLQFVQFSDKFHELRDAEIRVFDAHGSQLNKYKKREMNAVATGEGLVADGKAYFFRVSAPAFPITVQYDYEVKYNGTLNYPDFDIQDPDQAVEYSMYTAKVPAELDIRYKPQNIVLKPEIITDGKNKVYKWEVKNLAAIQKEDGSVSYESRYPRILIAPNKFDMDGYKGDLTTWKNFGKWYGDLSEGSINLSEERKIFLQQLIKNASTDKEKIQLIYKYLQNNFRYVSIQLGIGGYKPFEADFVDKKKYGDCKALSNYTQACLNAVGIKSYQALINATYNKEPVDPNFPHNSFNHVIVCVPFVKDTVWLECTSSTNDFGVLGSFTENRNALLITEDGGVLVSTPKSTAAENIFNVNTSIKFSDDGSGETNSVIKSTGEYKQDIVHYVMDEKKDDQKDFLVNHFGFPQPDQFELTTNNNQPAVTSLKLILEKVPDFSAGSKMFLNPRIYKIWNTKLPADEKRKHDFYFHCPFQKTDTTVYTLPEDYTVETLPRSRNIKFEFGSFKTNYVFNDKEKTVTTHAMLVLNQNKIPADKFEATRKFFSDVIEEYTDKIVIKKN